MSKLGYTWYPQNWRASSTFRRLKRFPLVRYALRELFDLMYEEGAPIEMNRDFLEDDFDIGLTDSDYEKMMEYIKVDEEGKWWSDTVSIRINKAEAARKNGAKGGRPKNPKTQDKNPVETQGITQDKAKEKEKEKEKVKEKEKKDAITTDGIVKKDFKRIPPTEKEVLEFAVKNKPDVNKEKVSLRYRAWLANDWKDANDKPIRNWSSKVLNALGDMGSKSKQTKQEFVKTYEELV